MTSADDLRSHARAAGFDELADELVTLSRPALVLAPSSGDVIVGRLGGQPRLPVDAPWPRTRWPTLEGEPLAFIAELDLAALDPAVWPDPSEGTLNFFCYIDAEAMYVDSGGAALVLHHPAGERLEPLALPDDLDEELRFSEVVVRGAPVTTLPWVGVGPARELIPLGLDAMEDIERATDYCRLVDDVQGHRGPGTPHQLLGWPRFTQDDVAYSWPTLHDEGLEHGTVTEQVESRDWRLLLQIGADGNLGASFGDGGDLFFGIPHTDLLAGRFDRVEAITDSG